MLNVHVLPAWQDREFTSIRKSDVAALLDDVEDNHGARQADYVLAITRGIMNWYASRNDDYVPPIVRGMQRTKDRARNRMLSDDEIRAVWKVAKASGAFGALIRLLLLTAQRREKVVTMRWEDIAVDRATWSIPDEARERGNAKELVLPKLALEIIAARDNPFTFPSAKIQVADLWRRAAKLE